VAAAGPGATPRPGAAAPSTIQPGTAPPQVRRVLDKALNGQKATFTVTYRFTTGTGAARETNTWRLAQAPPKFRFERLTGADRELTVFDGKAMYHCQTVAGKRTCSNLGGVPDVSNLGETHPGSIVEQLNSMRVMFGAGVQPKTASKTVAGRRLECVTYVINAGGAPDPWLCLTSQGVVGYAAFAGSTLTMTRLSSGVRANDFTVPR
jgi:hypothetical protein